MIDWLHTHITRRTGFGRYGTSALILATLLLSAVPISAGEVDVTGDPLESLAWMAGCWGSSEGSGSADECWLSRRGNMMIGFHVDVLDGGRVFYEYLRIVADDDTVTYIASPMGSGATPFVLVESAAERAVFENAAHDWPQRLTYWREGNSLHARAEGLDASSRKVEWIWQRRVDPSP